MNGWIERKQRLHNSGPKPGPSSEKSEGRSMWQRIYDLFTRVFTLTQRLERVEQEQKDLRQELREMSVLMQRLAYGQQRANDELRRTGEREEAERRILKLELENQLL